MTPVNGQRYCLKQDFTLRFPSVAIQLPGGIKRGTDSCSVFAQLSCNAIHNQWMNGQWIKESLNVPPCVNHVFIRTKKRATERHTHTHTETHTLTHTETQTGTHTHTHIYTQTHRLCLGRSQSVRWSMSGLYRGGRNDYSSNSKNIIAATGSSQSCN